MGVLGKGCWRFYKGASCVRSWDGRWYQLLNGNRAEGWISGVQSRTYYMWDACEKYKNIESNISVRSMEPWMELEIGIWVVCLTVVLKAVAMHEITKESVWPKKTRWNPGDLNIKSLCTNNRFYLTSPKEFLSGCWTPNLQLIGDTPPISYPEPNRSQRFLAVLGEEGSRRRC